MQIADHLDFVRDNSKVFPLVADPRIVRSLRIWHCKFTDLSATAEFTNLEELCIAGFTGDDLEVLRFFPKLTYLWLMHMPKVKEISALEELRHLRSLSLATLPSWDVSGRVSEIESLAPIGECQELKHLELFAVRPSDRSLLAIERCQALQTARFSKYPRAEVSRFYAAMGVRNAFNPPPTFSLHTSSRTLLDTIRASL